MEYTVQVQMFRPGQSMVWVGMGRVGKIHNFEKNKCFVFENGIQGQDSSQNLRSLSHKYIAPNSLIIPLLHEAGFGNLSQIESYKIDNSLITALVERWRPETHTFHLPTGECTITLEDVVLLLRLRVGGKAVTGSTMVSWTDDFLDLLGVMPPESQRKGNFIKLKWAYILELIGGILMPDKSHNRVHIMWLHLLRDLRETGQYSWGSACLATLYRELCRASEPGVMSIGGCLHLLQTYSGKGMKSGDTPRYHTAGYQSKIDHMTFIWRPYLGLTYDHPEHNWLWNASTYLICFYIIEMHQTDRVKLQFGLPQEIPHPPRNMRKYHKVDLHKQVDYSWALFYENENKEWNE
ncbi:serine/threonine-protein phosphatase 7 long form homolog [Cicer arietinum]|uniref:serine/threonine-protein phosphatase 7 long form homolog n=1 Tax=Cicer arietinum TaxID=3827 RepID=UPI003CC596E7